ncbi:MAG: hypothetical protein BWY75_00476 [bacterium ADurb.Bin425]|nr:MAG: hypothetical protein BWY75_00476 [bacterium ADurb.Bin425]
MCLSNNRYQTTRVTFSDTILLGAEVEVDGKIEHLLGYYNKVATSGGTTQQQQNHLLSASPALTAPTRRGSRQARSSDFDWSTPPGKSAKPSPVAVMGNAMLIAVPASPGTLTAANLIPVSDYPSFMQDYAKAVGPRTLPRGPLRRGGMLGGKSRGVEVVKGFDKGTYDVLIAGSAKAIAGALDQVDQAKRPTINQELYAQLDKLYPRWTFVLFCFEPMQKFSHLLYLPGLDGQNGQIETGKVELNHTLVAASCKMSTTAATRAVDFSDFKLQEDLPFMPDKVLGKVVPAGTLAPQGDFLLQLKELRAGVFRARRALPPGWKNVFGESQEAPYYIQN